ncbi:hypothetical protein CK203_022884 [Vitis vinifera]|uniref:Uncharacterized protein n=1 Tax=Vitis vinifera TaxID=29760 RepID=A0A438IWN1_VITVI|nr:hypothetical protein CK203_022884 [Vitis vinifera]
MATREITKRRSGGNGKEIVLGWSRRFLKLRWRREECVKNGKEDKWEKGWKKKGRSYSMVREANKGLKRKLGLAWLEEGQVLLEFEFVEEARRVLTFGKRSVGGIQIVPDERLGATEAHALTREWNSRVTQGSRHCHEQLTGRKDRSRMKISVDGTGRVLTVGRIQFGSTIQSSVGGAEVGSSLIGLTEDTLGLSHGPTEFQLNKGPLGKSLTQPKSYGEVNIELEFLSMREKEVRREQQVDFHYSLTDSTLAEEVSRNVENRVVWVFTSVYGQFTRVERECLWEEIGAIRGIWEGPWCLGGDFNIILSQSERSNLVGWSSEGYPGRPRITFQFYLRGGIEVRGSAGFRLTAKLKELKQKLKVWNREVFGNLECNKDAALQQVEYWDRVKGERSLTVEELACKKEAKEGYTKWKGGVEDLGDFRPISLLGGHYKLLAKVLANRLKKVIGKVVFPYQNVFVKRRQILDASLTANEVINAWNKMGEKWIISKYLVMVNEVLVGFFSSLKGLRQGDPISSYLFVMGMEVLSVLIRRVVEGGFISRLRINLAKNEIILIGEMEEVDEMAVELGCKVGQLPAIYLGLPLGAPNKAVSGWDGVEEKVRRRLAIWKKQYISKGENLEKKVHLVKWEVVCEDKEKGGLGMRKLTLLNKVLLGKWILRFACDKEALWKQVFLAKYGQEDFGWRTKKVVGVFGVGVWKEILKEAGWYWENLAFKVGKDNKIRFWTDLWCGDIALSQRFSHLFNLAAHRNATIEEMWDQNFGEE